MGIVIVDIDFHALYANQAFLDIFNLANWLAILAEYSIRRGKIKLWE